MIVLVGAVFADPTVAGSDASNGQAVIIVNATITEDFPTFALKTKTNADIVKDDVAIATEQSPLTPEEADISSNTLTGNANTTVGFQIVQIDKSVTTAHYQFSVAVTPLVLVKTVDGAIDRTLEEALTAADATYEKFAVAVAAPLLTAVGTGNTTYTATGSGTATLTLTYKGVPITGTEQNPVELATFDAAWQPNPNAKAGDYQAKVTLTVTAV